MATKMSRFPIPAPNGSRPAWWRQRLRARVGGALLAAGLASLGGCGDDAMLGDGDTDGAGPAPAAAVETIPVFATTAEQANVAQPLIGTGTIAAHMSTDVKPAVSGVVDEVLVTVGDRVEEGQPLLRLRASEYQLQARQGEQNVLLAEAELRDAERVLATHVELAGQGAVSRNALEDARTRREVAAARVGVARAQLEQSRQNLADTVLKAPFRGVVTERNVNVGAYIEVRMGGGGMMGSPPPLQIQKIDIVGAIVFLPEAAVGRVAVGTPARVTVDGIEGEFDSQVHIVNDRVDHQTRTVEVRVGIANDDYRIKPGLFCRAEFQPEPRAAVVVGRNAVRGSGDGQHVFVEQGGRAVRRPVQVRELDTDRVEVSSGLAAGERVLFGPALGRLFDGAPVTIQAVPG